MNETDKQEVIIAPGVAESIVSLAVESLEGVAQVGTKTGSSGGLFGIFTKNSNNSGVLIFEDEGEITVALHLKLYYGYKIQEVAAKIRAAVSDALLAQACINIGRVDITVDGIVFKA